VFWFNFASIASTREITFASLFLFEIVQTLCITDHLIDVDNSEELMGEADLLGDRVVGHDGDYFV